MTTEHTSPRRRALVVDDDPVLRLLAEQALSRMGFAVEGAQDGEEALRAVDREPPSLVLLDVEMPGMDGFQTCMALRRRPAGSQIPVLMATGMTDVSSIERAFQAGATDFIAKPLDWQLLQHRVRFLMRAHDAFGNLRHTLSDLRSSQERLANAQRLARMGNWEWVPGSTEMTWSAELHRILGLDPQADAPTTERFLAAVHPEDRALVEKAFEEAREARPWSLDHRLISATGRERVVHQQAEVVLDESGAPERVVGTLQDITERRRAQEQIRFLAYYDNLTGLPNRRMLGEHLGRAIDGARRGSSRVAVLFLDLDRFKRVNDTLGHAAGDELLKAVSRRLLESVRVDDRVAGSRLSLSRPGGDEFAVILPAVQGSEEAATVARRILQALRAPFSVAGQEFVMSSSIGIAVHPDDGADAETLLKNADTAMYHAKQRGRGLYQFFSESLNRQAVRRLELESGLRAGLERDEFSLRYQPQWDARRGSIVGVEALLVWESPELGNVGPSEFVPLAEEIGLVPALGRFALKTACAQARAWQEAGMPPLHMAVNVSSVQLRQPGLEAQVEQALRESGLAPERLELEITESAILGDEPEVVETLRAIHARGVRLALDDFGTGYSSLTHLVRFPIDVLKIDRSFVSEIGSGKQGRSIVAAVIAMARRLGLCVVAEGVETEVQAEFLRAEGCDLLQGYHLARPMSGDALSVMLRRSF